MLTSRQWRDSIKFSRRIRMFYAREDPGTVDDQKTCRHTPGLPPNVDAEKQQSQEHVEQKKWNGYMRALGGWTYYLSSRFH